MEPVFAAASAAEGLGTTINKTLSNTAEIGGYVLAKGDLATVIGGIILGIITLLGAVFLVLIVYAGFKWMLAQGEENKITEARNLIVHSIVGLIIVLAAYAISYFIINTLQQAV